MLTKIMNPEIVEDVSDVSVATGGSLHVATLSQNDRDGKTALYIHGSGTIGNHTIVKRPSRWLIDRGVYDTIIMPDRRGCGASSPWTYKPTIRGQAEDMKALLDALDVNGPLDVLGISTGGPIALTHAYLDTRVSLVGLISSSPTLNNIAWPWNWLIKTGIVSTVMKMMYCRQIGKAESRYIDYDFMYEWEDPSRVERWEKFKEILRHTPEERLDSVMYEFNATLDPENAEIPEDVHLDIPVLQVIGTEDETWGSDMPEKYRQRFQNLHRKLIPGADHGDSLTKSKLFHEELAILLNHVRNE